MRVSAQIVFAVIVSLLLGLFFKTPAYAQTAQSTPQSTSQATNNAINYILPNTDPNVPINHHSYTQILLIDGISAVMCVLTGVDPSNPNQPCLGVNPTTGKIGLAKMPNNQTFGQAQSTQIGGAMGLMAQSIGTLYVPAVTSSQYVGYLASNFGIVKKTYAATNSTQNANCTNSPFGYGFCGLTPIFVLWSDMRDLSYALLTLLFIAIGVGVMLRFRVDPRTVMTLQNQIPRVIIAILLITFSYAIAGVLIDLMWTVTYTGIAYISNAAPNSKIQTDCNQPAKTLSQGAEQQLLDQPISFTNTILSGYCYGTNGGIIKNGLLTLSTDVAGSLGDLVSQLIHDLLFGGGSGCHFSWWDLIPFVGAATLAKCALDSVALSVFLWLTEILVKLIILVAILIALFRLWFKLIQAYLTFLIFVILGPLWIVLGLVPGRPMGFEKWLRIIFSNLAVFPIVAFILVFARVILDSAHNMSPNQIFVPPLIGNPNIGTFSTLMAFGAIMLAPSIPDLIKERMKATGQAKYGAAIAGAALAGATAFTSPGKKIMESMNRRDPHSGEPEGPLAVMKQRALERMPGLGRRRIANESALKKIRHGAVNPATGQAYTYRDLPQLRREALVAQGNRAKRRTDRKEAKLENKGAKYEFNEQSRFGKVRNRVRERLPGGRAAATAAATRQQSREDAQKTAERQQRFEQWKQDQEMADFDAYEQAKTGTGGPTTPKPTTGPKPKGPKGKAASAKARARTRGKASRSKGGGKKKGR